MPAKIARGLSPVRCARASVLVETMARELVFYGPRGDRLRPGRRRPGSLPDLRRRRSGDGHGRRLLRDFDDASAAYWNPAGLSQLQRKEVTTMQATLFQGVKLTYFSFAYPTKSGSTFALSMTQLANPGFEKVDVVLNPRPTSRSRLPRAARFPTRSRRWACPGARA